MRAFYVSLALVAALANPAEAAGLTLKEAIARAVAQHPDALGAEAQLQNAGLAVEDAQAQRLQLAANVSGLGRHAQSGLMGTAAEAGRLETAALNSNTMLTVPLFTGFKISNSVLSAEKRRDAAGSQREATLAELTLEVTRAFWGLHRQELLEGLQVLAIAQAEKTRELTQAGFKLGRLTSNDVDRAEVEILNAQGELLRAQSRTRETRTQLATIVGLPAEALAIEVPATPDEAPEPISALNPGASSPAAHPRIQAAEARLAASRATVAMASGDRWPQLALISSYQYGNNPFNPALGASGLSASFSGIWDVRLGLSYNVFDLGRIDREVARAENDRRLAEAELERVRREVEARVALATIRLENAEARYRLAEQGGAIAERTLRWVEMRYQQGYSPLIEVIEARRSLLTARTQRVEALVDQALARAERQAALGTQQPLGGQLPRALPTLQIPAR